MAREEIEAFMRDHGVTVSAVFVPWSKSRSYDAAHAKPGGVMKRNLNWRVTVERAERVVVGPFDFSAGIAHAPSYKQNQRVTLDVADALKFETEQGYAARGTGSVVRFRGAPILPDPCDVLACIATDAAVLDARGFEEWAAEFGYDVDSRKAESIYQACLKIALEVRSGLGDDGLRALQTAAEGY